MKSWHEDFNPLTKWELKMTYLKIKNINKTLNA